MLNIVFFGQLRERLATSAMMLDIKLLGARPNVGDLRRYLSERGAEWTQLLHPEQSLVAVNQTMVNEQCELSENDEVALFPPVTGG